MHDPEIHDATHDESPAAVFERFFGPTLFGPWAEVLLEHIPVRPTDRVLDLACATGTVARRLAGRPAPLTQGKGHVTGFDLNPDMLAVARERAEAEGLSIDWVEGDATATGLPDASFDVVLCQQGLQFFSDPAASVREARRVLAPGGRAAWSVWDALPHHPVYSALLEAEARHLGARLDDLARPFMFEGAERLAALLWEGGFKDIQVTRRIRTVEFGDPERFVALTILAGAAVVPEHSLEDPHEQEALIEAISRDTGDLLARYRDGDRLRFPMPCFIGTGRQDEDPRAR
jgi:SAM-dependent methyltransferase